MLVVGGNDIGEPLIRQAIETATSRGSRLANRVDPPARTTGRALDVII